MGILLGGIWLGDITVSLLKNFIQPVCISIHIYVLYIILVNKNKHYCFFKISFLLFYPLLSLTFCDDLLSPSSTEDIPWITVSSQSLPECPLPCSFLTFLVSAIVSGYNSLLWRLEAGSHRQERSSAICLSGSELPHTIEPFLVPSTYLKILFFSFL